MQKFMLAFLVAVVTLSACRSDANQGDSGNQAAETLKTVDPATVGLVCQPIEEPNAEADAPRHEVFIQMGDRKVKVADILNCSTLTPDQYASYQIPVYALQAVLGWWAGGGDIIYIVREGENYVVKQGYVEEEMEPGNFGYKTVLTFSKEGKEL